MPCRILTFSQKQRYPRRETTGATPPLIICLGATMYHNLISFKVYIRIAYHQQCHHGHAIVSIDLSHLDVLDSNILDRAVAPCDEV